MTEEIIKNLSQTTSVPSAAMAALHAVEAREAEKQARKDANLAEAINGNNDQNGQNAQRTTPPQSPRRRSNSASSRATPVPESDSDDFALDDSDYDSSDSFCLVPSKTNPGESSSSSRKLLRKENVELKEQLDALRGQVITMRRQMAQRAEQDQQLKDHIMKARSEVGKFPFI